MIQDFQPRSQNELVAPLSLSKQCWLALFPSRASPAFTLTIAAVEGLQAQGQCHQWP